jgi:ABC-type spermidine/putrescine transport system permease subunit I
MAAVQGGMSQEVGSDKRAAPGISFPALLRSICIAGPVVLVAVMILGPLAMMAVVSFWTKSGFSMKPDLSLKAYETFLGGVRFSVFLRSLWVAVTSTGIMLLIAYPIAYFIARHVRADAVRSMLFLFSVPFLVNYILRTFAWADILGRMGWINQALMGSGLTDAPLDWLLYSDFSVYLGLVTAYMPFMIFPIWLSLSGIDRRFEEASWMLGEGPLRSFLRVTLPLSFPGVFAAAIFGFVGAFGEFAISTVLGGTGYQLLGNSITSALDVINYPLAAAMSTFTVTVMALLLILWFRLFDVRLFLGKIMGRT